MSAVSVKVSRNGVLHRFSLDPASPTINYPTFQSLCDALVQRLHLPTTGQTLADSTRTPFHILFLDNHGEYSRLLDDLSLRDALRHSKKHSRLTLRVSRRKFWPPGNAVQPNHEEEVLADEAHADDHDKGHCDPPVHVFSPSTLLKLLNHLRDDGSSSVSSALVSLERCVKCHAGDARALRRRRHELAGLFSIFLAQAALPGPSCIPKSLGAPFIENLRAALQRASVSKHTTDAALRAVKVVCNCKPAVASLRSMYAEAACQAASRKADAETTTQEASSSSPDTVVVGPSMRTAVMAATAKPSDSSPESRPESRPVNHYVNQFRKMRHVAGPEVKDAYKRFEHARRRAGDMFPFELDRKLCRGLQRAAFHFLRCHVSAPDYEFEKNAVRALAASVARKLLRAGFDRRLIDVTMQLVAAMATDEAVIKLAYSAANAEMAEVPIGEIGMDQGAHGEDPYDSGELEAMAEAAEEEMLVATSRKSHSNPASRPQSIHEAMGGEDGSNESLPSVDSLHEEEMAQSMKKKMNQISPVHSSEDLSPDGGKYGDEGGSDGSTSTNTERSEWARVERAKEREEQLRKARQLDRTREMQMVRERQVELDLARERRKDEDIERHMERLSRGSHRRSRMSSRAGSSRGPGVSVRGGSIRDSVREGSMRGSLREGIMRGSLREGSMRDSLREGGMRGSMREGSMRGSHRSMSVRAREQREYEGSRGGSAYMREGPREAPSSHSGSIDPGEEGSMRGSERRSIRSGRSRGESHGSAMGSVSRSRAESHARGSVASSRRASSRH